MNSISLLSSRASGTTIFAAILLLTGLINCITIIYTPFSAETYFIFTPRWFHFISLITAIWITPYLIHLEPPLSTDAFTLTRPIDHSKLLRTKTLLIWSLGAVVPALGETLIILKAGIPLDSLALAAIFFLIRNSSFISIFLVVAALTKKHLDFNIVCITTALVAVLIWYGRTTFGMYPLRAFYHDPPFAVAESLARADARLALALYGVVSVFGIVAVWATHYRKSLKTVGLILGLGIALSLGIQLKRVLIVRNALPDTLTIPSRTVKAREPSVFLTETTADDKGDKRYQLSFSVPLEEDSDSRFPYLLRFKEFWITDDTGREFSVPVANFGMLPCIDAKTLERFLTSKLGSKISIPDAPQCELGEKYVLPKEAKLSKKSLPKVRGTAWGFNHELNIDYSASIKDGVVHSTPRGPIRAVRYKSTFGRFIHTGRGSNNLVTEIEFFPTILTRAYADPGEGSPLYVHYYASAKNYVLLQTGPNIGKRYWADIRRTWNESVLSEFRVFDPNFIEAADSYDEPIISDEDLKEAVLYRMFPRILGSFTTDITLENVPIVRRLSSKEE